MSKSLKVHITGEGTIYRNDTWGYPQYTMKLANQKDGEWLYDYIQVGLPKNSLVNNNTQIKINDGFFTFFVKNDGSYVHKIVITSFDIVNEAVGEINIPSDNTVNFDTDLPW